MSLNIDIVVVVVMIVVDIGVPDSLLFSNYFLVVILVSIIIVENMR